MMRQPKSQYIYACLAFGVLQIHGCAGALTPEGLTTGSLANSSLSGGTPADAPLSGGPLGTNSQHRHLVSGTHVAVYTLVARGAQSCWLGVGRPLAGSHRFNAQVPSTGKKGGTASIVIYERSASSAGASPARTGERAAMRITIEPLSTSRSSITIVNRQFPIADAARMSAEVRGWAGGDLKCAQILGATTTGIADAAAAPGPAKAATTNKSKAGGKR